MDYRPPTTMISRWIRIGSLGCLLLVVLASAIPAHATQRHVPTAAYPTISAGLSAAVPGDDVLVDCGTYNESGLVMPSGVWLHSQSGQPSCVTIDAQGNGRVMSGTALAATTKIEGITLTGGSAPLGGHGGGFLCNGGSPIFINCLFENNIIQRGGGGGAASLMNANAPIFISCTFDNNRATQGGAVDIVDTPGASFTDCVFSFNSNRNQEVEDPLGGGIYCLRGTGLALTRCVFYGNHVEAPSFSGAGGAIYIDDTLSAFLSNCTLVDNSAFAGGAMLLGYYSSNAEVMNTIIAFNASYLATGVGPVFCYPGSSAVFTCCDVFGNRGEAGVIWDWFGCLEGQLGIRGNLSDDPLFCDGAGQDYRLQTNSPCAPEHSPSGCGLIGGLPVGCAISLVSVDFKPGACPNPLNARMSGNAVIPVAILGGDTFDVTDIDPATVALEGVPALRSNREDVSTPVDPNGEDCECTTEGADGLMDLTLKFNYQAVVAALGPVADGQLVEAEVTGELTDGTPFSGTDCFLIRHGVLVGSPNGGEVLSAGSTEEITWTWLNLDFNPTEAAIYLSTDGGITYPNKVGTSEPIDGSFTWMVPELETRDARILVVLTDSEGGTASDESDATFEISRSSTGVPGAAGIPSILFLGRIAPQPFSGTTTVRFGLPMQTRAELAVYDVDGRMVKRLATGDLPAGTWERVWDGRDDAGRKVPSGTYFLRLSTPAGTETQRLTLLR